LVTNDGATAGGFPVALECVSRYSDVNSTAKITDRQIAYASLTAARTITLEAASAYPSGALLTIVDESGMCSAALTLTIARAGSDTINGGTSAILAAPYSSLVIESNGVNGWVIVNQTSAQATTTMAQSATGAQAQIVILEQLAAGLSGSSVTAGVQIPAGAQVLACASRVKTTITGATSFEVGYTGSPSAFGSSLALTAGSTNQGMISPNPFYTAQNLIITAIGSNFTAGAVRLSLIYMTFSPPLA
jgi:hypothetical protein